MRRGEGMRRGRKEEEGGKGRRTIERTHEGVEWLIDEGSRVLQGRLGINH